MSDSNLPATTTSLVAASPEKRPAILVVDDNQTLNRVLCELLQVQGYTVDAAYDGREALDFLRTRTPDLIISDVVMPQIDGYELLRKVRDNPATHHVPVIFLTAFDTPEGRRRAKEAGAVDFLTKPLDDVDLLVTVRAALSHQFEVEAAIQRRVEAVRNEILGLIQHEFRTPLTFIMGYAEFLHSTLHEEIRRDEIEHSVAAILEGSRRLHHLVESFLMLATLSRESLPDDEFYPLDPMVLWRETVTTLHQEVNAARLRVLLVEPPDPIIAFGMMDLLREALTRLLDNAIRYRRPESTTILLTTAAKPGYVGWAIRDEGIGIAPELRLRLAEPFQRGRVGLTGEHGAGLGLSLARRVAELHGGYLEIESAEGVGSTFTLWVADREI
jgi:signal transduction histidine kinase